MWMTTSDFKQENPVLKFGVNTKSVEIQPHKKKKKKKRGAGGKKKEKKKKLKKGSKKKKIKKANQASNRSCFFLKISKEGQDKRED